MSTSEQALITGDEEEWDEGGEDYEEGGADEEDEDYDAEAEKIAQRLNEQLWADIAKAQAEVSAATTVQVAPPTPQPVSAPAAQPPPISESEPDGPREESLPPVSSKSKKQEAALMTMRGILALAYKDSVVRATLAATILPTTTTHANVLDVLNICVSSGSVERSLAGPLSDAVVSLAKSDVLFSSMRNSDAPAIQLDKGKRKRDATEDTIVDDRFAKKAAVEYPDLIAQISEAVRVITSAFHTLPVSDRPLDGSFVSSIQLQLHQVFLFAVTSAPRARPELVHALQELGGLIQMVGVLSDIPIGTAPSPWNGASQASPPDIGTAVYPCLVPACHKTFHRLYSLRTHQRLHALVDRPYRCTMCPASFQRNHDLKRHAKLHERTAWKCGGCGKIFSRRDAIKRHKDARGRGGKGHGDSACALADIEEVEVEKESGEEDASRRAKLWNGIVANQLAGAVATETHDDGVIEEGEVPVYIVHRGQDIVMQLHPVLQSRVAGALGNGSSVPGGPGQPGVPPVPPGNHGHPTLASVIARTQPQYHPSTGTTASNPTISEVHPSTHHSHPRAHSSQQHQPQPSAISGSGTPGGSTSDTSLSLSWLSEEQTKLLEQAIAQAAAAAQAQAEAEAALEEEEEGDEEDGEMYEVDVDGVEGGISLES